MLNYWVVQECRADRRNPWRPINQKPRCWPGDKIETFDLAPKSEQGKKPWREKGKML